MRRERACLSVTEGGGTALGILRDVQSSAYEGVSCVQSSVDVCRILDWGRMPDLGRICVDLGVCMPDFGLGFLYAG